MKKIGKLYNVYICPFGREMRILTTFHVAFQKYQSTHCVLHTYRFKKAMFNIPFNIWVISEYTKLYLNQIGHQM